MHVTAGSSAAPRYGHVRGRCRSSRWQSGRRRPSVQLAGVGAVFFSGTGAAVITAFLTGNTIAVETTTIRAPAVTEIREVNVSKDGRTCSGSIVAGGPPYEPNDRLSAAYGPLRSGVPIRAALEDSDDTDFFAFCVADRATVDVRILETDCELFPTEDAYPSEDCDGVVLGLLDDRGREIAGAEVDPKATAGAITKSIRPGRYYLRVSDGNGFRYELRVDAGEVPLQPAIRDR